MKRKYRDYLHSPIFQQYVKSYGEEYFTYLNTSDEALKSLADEHRENLERYSDQRRDASKTESVFNCVRNIRKKYVNTFDRESGERNLPLTWLGIKIVESQYTMMYLDLLLNVGHDKKPMSQEDWDKSSERRQSKCDFFQKQNHGPYDCLRNLLRRIVVFRSKQSEWYHYDAGGWLEHRKRLCIDILGLDKLRGLLFRMAKVFDDESPTTVESEEDYFLTMEPIWKLMAPLKRILDRIENKIPDPPTPTFEEYVNEAIFNPTDYEEAWYSGEPVHDDYPWSSEALARLSGFEHSIKNGYWKEYFELHTEELKGTAVIRMNTSKGVIDLELNWDQAPWIVFHFLTCVQIGTYDNTLLAPNSHYELSWIGDYRTWGWDKEKFTTKMWDQDPKKLKANLIKNGIEVIEAPFVGQGNVIRGGDFSPGYKLIQPERFSMLGYQGGNFTKAERGDICVRFEHDSNTSFFILSQDASDIDKSEKEFLNIYKSARVFGRVTSGMDVVDKISRARSDLVSVQAWVRSDSPPGEIGFPYSILVPKTEITLRNIKIISGSPTTKHYKLRSLSSSQRGELNKRTDKILGEIIETD